jgi:hypothetical protein
MIVLLRNPTPTAGGRETLECLIVAGPPGAPPWRREAAQHPDVGV